MKLELRMPQNIAQSAFKSPCGGPGNPCPPPSLANPCGDCSGERSYNATNFQPDCGFAGSPKPDQQPTKNKPPYINIVLPHQNTDAEPLPLSQAQPNFGNGPKGPPPPPSRNPAYPNKSIYDYLRNPLLNWQPTVNPNPNETMTYRQGKPCPPSIHEVVIKPPETPRPRLTSLKSNGTNPCENQCGKKVSGEAWNNTRTPLQTMQLFHIPTPTEYINIGKGPSGDQPILTTNLRRSSVISDDKCIPTYTTGSLPSQYTQRPINSQYPSSFEIPNRAQRFVREVQSELGSVL